MVVKQSLPPADEILEGGGPVGYLGGQQRVARTFSPGTRRRHLRKRATMGESRGGVEGVGVAPAGPPPEDR